MSITRFRTLGATGTRWLSRAWRGLPSFVRDSATAILEAARLKEYLFDGMVLRPHVEGFRTPTPDTPRAISTCIERNARAGIDGDYYEFGLYRGYTLWYAQQAADLLGLKRMRFFGFDSFQGLPTPTDIDAKTTEFGARDYACSRSRVDTFLTAAGIDWPRTTLVEGFYQDSLHARLKTHYDMKPASVILVDCDLYHSTVPVLEFVRSLLQDGSAILFDDWNCFEASNDMGQRKAFREFLERYPCWQGQESFSFGWHGQAFIVKDVYDRTPGSKNQTNVSNRHVEKETESDPGERVQT